MQLVVVFDFCVLLGSVVLLHFGVEPHVSQNIFLAESTVADSLFFVRLIQQDLSPWVYHPKLSQLVHISALVN
jgi:hypothetical protein